MPWPLPDDDHARLALATGYPYARMDKSYLFTQGQALPLLAEHVEHFQDRTPVVGHGSNRSPEQLRRKFGDAAVIPVTRAEIADYDVVYSAHLTRYGAVATNLRQHEGVVAEVWLNWLNPQQLARMHETELGGEIYVYGRLSAICVTVEGGPFPRLDEVVVYLSRNGYLHDERADEGKAPIGLHAIPAKGRPYRSLAQRDVLALVQQRYAPHETLEAFILDMIARPERRTRIVAAMREAGMKPRWPNFHALLEA